MSNVIKLKRGSGSDPSASDLVVGEVALRTDLGKLFTKKDDNSVVEISGGVEDGDITTSKIADDAVTYAKIQNVSATNRILGRDSSGAGAIEEITPANLRTMLNVADGATNVTNTNQLTNGAGFITATLTNEEVQDIVGGMLTGNTETGITVTYQDGDGTIDFVVGTLNQDTTGNAATATALETARTIAGTSFDGSANIDISYANLTNKLSVGDGGLTQNNFTDTLKSKLDGIASGATNVTNTNQLTNGAGFITATLTQEQVEDFVGGMVTGNTETGITVTYQDSDGTLDFVVASQTDNNFTNADHSKLDGIEAGATADQSASEIVALIADQTIAPSTIDMEDDEKILLGSGDDLELFHDGGNSFIRNATNDFIIQNKSGNDDNQIRIRAQHAEESIVANGNGSVDLYFNNSKKAETVTGGFTVTGTCTATAFSGDGSSLTGISAGATGGGSDEIFYENGQNVTTDYTITNGKNAMSAGPITIDSGVTVTVGSGETLTIV